MSDKITPLEAKQIAASREFRDKPSLIKGNTLIKHKSRCRICKHPDVEKIEELILALNFDKVINKYKVSESTIIRHIELTGLWDNKISEIQRALVFKNIIRVSLEKNSKKISDAYRIAVADQMNKITGAYKEAEKNSNLNELREMLSFIPKSVYIENQNVQNVMISEMPESIKPVVKEIEEEQQ